MVAADFPAFKPGEFVHIFPRCTMAVVGGIYQPGNESEVTEEKEIQK